MHGDLPEELALTSIAPSRHCERSEAISRNESVRVEIASSRFALLAKTSSRLAEP
jgi:hypothetical protein